MVPYCCNKGTLRKSGHCCLHNSILYHNKVYKTCTLSWYALFCHCLPSALLPTWINFNPAWISNHTPSNVWDKITYPFLNFNGSRITNPLRKDKVAKNINKRQARGNHMSLSFQMAYILIKMKNILCWIVHAPDMKRQRTIWTYFVSNANNHDFTCYL